MQATLSNGLGTRQRTLTVNVSISAIFHPRDQRAVNAGGSNSLTCVTICFGVCMFANMYKSLHGWMDGYNIVSARPAPTPSLSTPPMKLHTVGP